MISEVLPVFLYQVIKKTSLDFLREEKEFEHTDFWNEEVQ